MTNDQFTEWLESQIEATKDFVDRPKGERSRARFANLTLRSVLKKYRSLPTWIPVTPETMPPKGEWVIACTKHWTGVAKLRDLDYDDGITYEWEDETSEWVTGILAWMPRPAPYVPPAPPTK